MSEPGEPTEAEGPTEVRGTTPSATPLAPLDPVDPVERPVPPLPVDPIERSAPPEPVDRARLDQAPTVPTTAVPADPARQGDAHGRSDDPVGLVPLALAVAAALMLLGAILFALASASSSRVGSTDRFRLLGAAAGPVTALVALTAIVLVVEDRARRASRVRFAPVASGIATAVGLAVVLLGINGVLTDLTSDAGLLFRLSSLVTRLAPIGLGALTVWLSPTARARRRTPPAGRG